MYVKSVGEVDISNSTYIWETMIFFKKMVDAHSFN